MVGVPDHQASFSAAFGADNPAWFLNKAKRELHRYLSASSDEQSVDALLNFASTVISLEDWTYPGPMPRGEWSFHHRERCPEHMLVALIALVAKHKSLKDGRFSAIRIEGGLVDSYRVHTDQAVPTEQIEWLRQQLPGAMMQVQTLVDDDEIAGYDISVRVPALEIDGDLKATKAILERAVDYWAAQV